MTLTNEKSDCCRTSTYIGGDDREGTHYYVCNKCKQICDVFVNEKTPEGVSSTAGVSSKRDDSSIPQSDAVEQLVRDFTQVNPLPKSEVRQRLFDLVVTCFERGRIAEAKVCEKAKRHQLSNDKISRLEIIDHTKPLEEGGGRTMVFWDKNKKIELDYQDGSKTLKIFVTERNNNGSK